MAQYSIVCNADRSVVIDQKYSNINYSTGTVLDTGHYLDGAWVSPVYHGNIRIAVIAFQIPDELKKKRITGASLSICLAADSTTAANINGAYAGLCGYTASKPLYENEITWDNALVPHKDELGNLRSSEYDDFAESVVTFGANRVTTDTWVTSLRVDISAIPSLLQGTAFYGGQSGRTAPNLLGRVYSSRSSNKPYYRIEAEDATPTFTQMLPSGGYTDRAMAQTFSWKADVEGVIVGEIAPTATVLTVKSLETSEEQSFDVGPVATSFAVPANTLPIGKFSWRVAVTYDSGISYTSPEIEGTTASELPTTVPVYPANKYVYGEYEAEFGWNYFASTSEAQTRVDLQYSYDKVVWRDFYTKETANPSCVVPPLLLPAGKLWWRARTWNVHGAGIWSDSIPIIVQSIPSKPIIISVSNASRPVITWSSMGQISYEVRIRSEGESVYESEEVASIAFIHQVPNYLDNGEYTVEVRYKNSSQKFSEWKSAWFEINTEKPAPPEFRIENESVFARIVITNTAGLNPIYILRDGEPIAKVIDAYEDYGAVGKHVYTVRGVNANDSFSDSVPIEAKIELNCFATIAPIDNLGGYAKIKFRRNDPPTFRGDFKAAGESMHFAGRKYPIYEFGEFEDESYSWSFSVSDEKDRTQLIEILKMNSALLYRDRYGNCYYNVVTGVGIERDRVATDFEVSVQRVDYVERIKYDPPGE